MIIRSKRQGNTREHQDQPAKCSVDDKKREIKTSNLITVVLKLVAFHVRQASPSSHSIRIASLGNGHSLARFTVHTANAHTATWVYVLSFTLSLSSLITFHPRGHTNKHLSSTFILKRLIKRWSDEVIHERNPSVCKTAFPPCHLRDLSSQICVFLRNAFVLTQLHRANEQCSEIKPSER